MKLNKVLALALSGVMAVSMLAGCSGNPGNGGQNGEGEPPVVDNSLTGQVISALSKDTTDKVTFTSDNALGVTLQKAIDNAGYKYDELKNKNNANTIANLMGQVDSDLKNEILPYINDNSDDYTDREDSDKKEQNAFGVVVFDGQGYGAEYAVKQLAAEIEKQNVMGQTPTLFKISELPTYTDDYGKAGDEYYYTFKYTGTMSVVTVADTITGQTVYVAAYTITRTPTKVEK